MNELLSLLQRHRFVFGSEEELQAGIAQVLAAAGIEFEREAHLGIAGRIDFLARNGIGIECKVAGSLGDTTRQCQRYLSDPSIIGLILVTSRASHLPVSEACDARVLFVGGLQ